MSQYNGKKRGRPRKGEEKPQVEKRQYISVPAVIDRGIPCRHCGSLFGHRIANTYANGNRRRICGKCGLPFVTIRSKEAD